MWVLPNLLLGLCQHKQINYFFQFWHTSNFKNLNSKLNNFELKAKICLKALKADYLELTNIKSQAILA